jgi:hypothetical protein
MQKSKIKVQNCGFGPSKAGFAALCTAFNVDLCILQKAWWALEKEDK